MGSVRILREIVEGLEDAISNAFGSEAIVNRNMQKDIAGFP